MWQRITAAMNRNPRFTLMAAASFSGAGCVWVLQDRYQTKNRIPSAQETGGRTVKAAPDDFVFEPWASCRAKVMSGRSVPSRGAYFSSLDCGGDAFFLTRLALGVAGGQQHLTAQALNVLPDSPEISAATAAFPNALMAHAKRIAVGGEPRPVSHPRSPLPHPNLDPVALLSAAFTAARFSGLGAEDAAEILTVPPPPPPSSDLTSRVKGWFGRQPTVPPEIDAIFQAKRDERQLWSAGAAGANKPLPGVASAAIATLDSSSKGPWLYAAALGDCSVHVSRLAIPLSRTGERYHAIGANPSDTVPYALLNPPRSNVLAAEAEKQAKAAEEGTAGAEGAEEGKRRREAVSWWLRGDRPQRAELMAIPVEEDDVVVLVTDGVSKNLWNQEIASMSDAAYLSTDAKNDIRAFWRRMQHSRAFSDYVQHIRRRGGQNTPLQGTVAMIVDRASARQMTTENTPWDEDLANATGGVRRDRKKESREHRTDVQRDLADAQAQVVPRSDRVDDVTVVLARVVRRRNLGRLTDAHGYSPADRERMIRQVMTNSSKAAADELKNLEGSGGTTPEAIAARAVADPDNRAGMAPHDLVLAAKKRRQQEAQERRERTFDDNGVPVEKNPLWAMNGYLYSNESATWGNYPMRYERVPPEKLQV
eukprot:TRINITY_DN26694_c0_g1_i1.p1 TRINITY_DN26694_c0_g1~~TRINITY_DN26694_c0_g1_i1.p1  ORF type:complete len:649 (+),score=144.29 TRINITY_DN26694_c0_g1_i1:98-2044(+)